MTFWLKNAPGLRLVWQVLAYLRYKGIKGLVQHVKSQKEIWKNFPGWRAPAALYAQNQGQLLQWAAQKQLVQQSAAGVLLLAGGMPMPQLKLTLHSLANQTVPPRAVLVAGIEAGQLARCGKAAANARCLPQKATLHSVLEMLGPQTGFMLVAQGAVALHPQALQNFAQALQNGGAQFAYSDDEWFEGTPANLLGRRYKAGFGPDTLRGYNYIGNCFAVSAALAAATADFVPKNGYDALLRLSEKATGIARLPQPLLRTTLAAMHGDAMAAAHAVQAQMERLGLRGEVKMLPQCAALRRIRYKIEQQPMVSIIIQNKNHAAMLRRCVQSILQNTSWPTYEICIVENGSDEAETLALYEELEQDNKVRVLQWEKPWKYSALNNFGAQHAHGEVLLLLNNDVEVLQPGWMEEMLMYAQRADVGAVGCMLLYEDKTIQHAGVIVGICGAARHAFSSGQPSAIGYEGRLATVQNLTAVTAACLMVRKSVYWEAGGFLQEFAVGNNDVDFCLRLREKGLLNVYTPFCRLLHYESASRAGAEKTGQALLRAQREDALLLEKWPLVQTGQDPYYNPGLSAVDALFLHDARGEALHSSLDEL